MAGQGFAVSEFRPPSLFRAEVAKIIDPRPVLTITLLGSLRACDADGADLLPRVRKTRALLAILARAAPEPVPRSQLIALLWSRRELPQARGSLRQAVHELRGALGPAACLLRTESAHLALSETGLQVDAWRMLRATPGQPDALALWQGELLSDLIGLDPAFDRWLGEQRQALWRRARALGEAILAASHGPGPTTAAAERLLAIDAAHEGAWRALIRLHVERGEPLAAIGAYERCQAALAAHCQPGPSIETTALVTTPQPPVVRLQPGPRFHGTSPGTLVSPNVDDVVVTLQRRRAANRRVRLGITTLRGGATVGTAELAAGLAEELILALSRFRWLACVPCAPGQTELDVDFLLDGTVQCSGDRLRVLLRLTDLRAGGEVLWAERFDRSVTDIFALQEQLACAAAARLEPRLWLREGERSGAQGPGSRTALGLLSMAVPAVNRLDRRGFLAAGKLLDQSIELDPDNASTHAWAAQWHIFAVGQGWAANPAADVERARSLAERAIQLDPEDSRGLSLAGHVRGFIDRRPQEALALHERAIAINPSLPLSWCLSGLAYTYAGDCDAAIEQVRHAQMLSPTDPLSYFFEMALALAYLLRGDATAAVQAAQRAVLLNRGFSSSYKTLLAALGHLGRHEDAAEARAALLTLEPGFTVDQAVHRAPLDAPRARALYADGLRLGGLI
jgi:DNA-binding SARP family transcriptional activator/tetratricopeptide (TPR) repeat protein